MKALYRVTVNSIIEELNDSRSEEILIAQGKGEIICFHMRMRMSWKDEVKKDDRSGRKIVSSTCSAFYSAVFVLHAPVHYVGVCLYGFF